MLAAHVDSFALLFTSRKLIKLSTIPLLAECSAVRVRLKAHQDDAPGEAMGKLHTLILDSLHMHDQSNACAKNHFPFDVEVEWGATADGAVA